MDEESEVTIRWYRNECRGIRDWLVRECGQEDQMDGEPFGAFVRSRVRRMLQEAGSVRSPGAAFSRPSGFLEW